MRLALPALAAAICLGVAASAAGAAERDTGSIVVRLLTDPAPAGVAWSYSGAGPPFQLRASGSAKTISSLADGTYRLVEAGAAPGQPKTLTSLTCADPSGGTSVDTATATATIALTSGETVTCTFSHRALGPRPAASAVQLAAKYAPVLRFTAGERYKPLRLEDYLTKTDLRNGSPPRGTLQPGATDTLLAPRRRRRRRTSTSAAPSRPRARRPTRASSSSSRRRARGRASISTSPTSRAAGRVAIEYWFLYLYNDFYDQHEADWEGVTVVLDNGTPLGATYSQHQGRKWVPWSALSTTGGHPIVYVARGSHAEYPKPGSYSIVSAGRCTDVIALPRPASTPRAAAGRRWRPKAYDLQPFGGTGLQRARGDPATTSSGSA